MSSVRDRIVWLLHDRFTWFQVAWISTFVGLTFAGVFTWSSWLHVLMVGGPPIVAANLAMAAWLEWRLRRRSRR